MAAPYGTIFDVRFRRTRGFEKKAIRTLRLNTANLLFKETEHPATR